VPHNVLFATNRKNLPILGISNNWYWTTHQTNAAHPEQTLFTGLLTDPLQDVFHHGHIDAGHGFGIAAGMGLQGRLGERRDLWALVARSICAVRTVSVAARSTLSAAVEKVASRDEGDVLRYSAAPRGRPYRALPAVAGQSPSERSRPGGNN